MLDDIILFVHIVQSRGLAAAAKQLTLPAATVTRRLQKLESSLGCKLIHRSARQFTLTAEGQVYYSSYVSLVEQFEVTQRKLSAEVQDLSGKLKVLAPTNISLGTLQPMWSAFIKQYPDIQLELSLNNGVEDLFASQADIALRIGPQKDSSLYQKRLGASQTVLVASPCYIEKMGMPTTLNDLSQHKIIGTKLIPIWALINRQSKQKSNFHPRVVTMANDVTFVAQLTCDGIGVALLPITEVNAYIKEGKLVRILADWSGPDRDLYAVWPTGRLLSAKAKCLREFMLTYLQQNLNWLYEGKNS
ncbi:LysR family transcriptional regulator [Colwellia sp. 39_35_sub15_T18]|nr:LysR family transcriptional regulator [Colwellia sp. 39_35_sub15_T18]